MERLEVQRFILEDFWLMEEGHAAPRRTDAFIATSSDVERSPKLNPGSYDLALGDLSEDAKLALNAEWLPWMNTLGFCSIYIEPPAQRVKFAVGDDGRVQHAMFYRESRWLGFFRQVIVAGISDIEEIQLRELMDSRRAHLATGHRLVQPRDGTASRLQPNAMTVSNDVIVELPGQKDQYLQSLGKQKRQQLPRYWRRLQREFNDRVTFGGRVKGDIALGQIVQLIQFNQQRMQRKGHKDSTHRESKRQMHREPLTQSSGLLCTLQADDRVLGGTFSYVHGGEAFAIVIGHDPQLERLELGNLALWKTIEFLIEQGVKRYHLLWGSKSYKARFGGKDCAIVQIAVARNAFLIQVHKQLVRVRGPVGRAVGFVRSRLTL
jgi:hypothetical protein